MRTLRLAALSLVVGWLGQPLASAHDAQPLSVDIKEQSAGLHEARIRVPPTVTDDDLPVVVWPADCRVVGDHRVLPPTPQEVVVACAGGLEGQTHYTIYNPSLSTLFRLSRTQSSTLTQVLAPEAAEWSIPRESTWMRVALSYLELGIRRRARPPRPSGTSGRADLRACCWQARPDIVWGTRWECRRPSGSSSGSGRSRNDAGQTRYCPSLPRIW